MYNNSSYTNNGDQINCRIEQNEKYTNELNEKICDTDFTQKHDIHKEVSVALAELDMAITTDAINGLICRHNELSREYNINREQLIYLKDVDNRLKNENEQTYDQLNEEEALLEKLENLLSTLFSDLKKLQIEFEDTSDIVNKYHDRKQLVQVTLREIYQDLICTQNALADKIILLTQIKKDSSIEQAKNESLVSLICELNMEQVKTLRCSKIEITDLQSIFHQKLSKIAAIERKVANKQDEAETQKYRTIEFKKGIQELREMYFNEKNKTEKVAGQLKSNVKTLNTDIKSKKTKLSVEQIENDKLICQIKGQEEKINLLVTNKNHLQQELTTNMVKMGRDELNKEFQMLKRKLKLKNENNIELEESTNIQNEQFKKLKNRILDIKLKSTEACKLDMTALKKLEICIDDLLSDKKEDSITDLPETKTNT